MNKSNIKTSGFTLAKQKELIGDDFYDIKTIGNLSIAIVCDGVGSAEEGAQAAKRVTSYLINNFKIRPKTWSIEKSIKTFINSINSILYKESQLNYERSELVTTLAIVVIEGNRLYGANVGDSRVYLLRDDSLTQLSSDHVMQEEGYENVLTQAIGISEDVQPFYFENIVQKNDKILLCSDGLYNELSEEIIKNNISKGAIALVKQASKLANDPLRDDTTAVVLEIVHADEVEILKQQKLNIPQSLKAGQIIDGYRLEKPLIQNERTWLASKKTKQYVIKFAPIEAKDDNRILDLFVKEAWNAKRLKASFFPKAVIPKNRTCRYYVMQLFNADDLNSYLASHLHVSIDDAVELARTLLDMSQFLLKYDLVHGDIKPNNIMIAKTGEDTTEYKIIDFGSITEIFSEESRAGTPSFLAPERFQGETISETTEIFAIGVTLYLSLTGKYPYGEIEPFQNPSFKEAKKPSHYNSNIPDWLDSVIMRSIALDKDQRYEHYSEMKYELTHPQKVKPYFIKNAPLIEKSPLLFYKSAFTIMTVINFILIYLVLK
ncbi:bifunctional protein-serine/threonine kinase/phosphatase [Sulfurimonas autotrophica]|uniref:Protein serine/threonine phosphatase n=1 Tax=Sulfurimonas autotrophica (strain ATCC BAA-671 / DSM 16294 / JCM 11897 / OK10) TaxID=563040 RepID=E0UQH2_SULAO|nr:bifunctional protein-serine/threonine kinase/phosphatase [Sulfurimonas autotrophica]ADN08774.1 protein serine/threonine phosphatase [Sulfurimonas autotrophica DSM 16294]